MGDLKVLSFPLDLDPGSIVALGLTLTAAERERARRFAFPEQRRRWIVARGQLRKLLGERIGTDPRDVRLEADANGKPCVPGGVQFNMAHSHELAVVALTDDREVGVDVERLRPLADRDELAAEVFSSDERDALVAVPQERRDAAFLAAWTRKESYLKARGIGLRLAPAEIAVSITGPARLVSAPDAERWSLRAFVPAPGYVGALTVARL